MKPTSFDSIRIARYTGFSLLATILIGIVGALTVGQGIDINLNADVKGTAENMLVAEQSLRAKAYLGILIFGFEMAMCAGLFLLLRNQDLLYSLILLLIHFGASLLTLLGSVYAMIAAHIAVNPAYMDLTQEMKLLINSIQATSDYASFHLGLVMSSAAKGGFFYLFLKSRLIPKTISGWGFFASFFVAIAIVARDFVPILGHDAVTASFMACNLVAILSLGIFLSWKGVNIEEG